MGRRPALSPEVFAEAERRHLINGTPIRVLAREYGVDEAALRRRINPQKSADKSAKSAPKSLKSLADEKISADRKSAEISASIAVLPMFRQETFNDLIRRLNSVSHHLISAAELGAMNAHRLSALANAQVQKIDDANPEKCSDVLKLTSVLTSMSNESSKLGVALISANKDAMAQIDPDEDLDAGTLTDEQIEAEITKTVARLRVGAALQA